MAVQTQFSSAASCSQRVRIMTPQHTPAGGPGCCSALTADCTRVSECVCAGFDAVPGSGRAP